ncbi:MAG: GNAT family N-acetyltransferase [Anaerolineae bacterium]|nr:GNAT family N-acetyltransferase [Anaerolineae bacterium]
MPHYRRLVGELCYLSPCTMDDAAQWVAWHNDLEVTIPLGDEAYVPYSLERAQQDLGTVLANQEHVFAIVDLVTDAAIGRCMLFMVDYVNRTAMLGIVIGDKEHWDRGYGQDAVRLLLDHAFSLLNLKSVMLGTFAFNERAIRCYRKVGFREIGRRRQARLIAGRAYDVVLMDILAEEYRSAYVSRLLPDGDTA